MIENVITGVLILLISTIVGLIIGTLIYFGIKKGIVVYMNYKNWQFTPKAVRGPIWEIFK